MGNELPPLLDLNNEADIVPPPPVFVSPGERQIAPNSEKWCLTLPLVEERSFTVEEETLLRQQRRHETMGAILLGIFGTIASFVGMMVTMLFSKNNLGLSALAFIFGMPLIALCVFQGYRFLEHALLLSCDLRNGLLQRYAGVLEANAVNLLQEKVGKPLKRTMVVGENCELQVYAGSGRLKSASSQVYHGWDIKLPCSKTAATPPYAAIAAQWLDRVDTTESGDAVFMGNRELSAEELAEIRASAFRCWWQPCRTLLTCASFPAILLMGALLNHKPYSFQLGLLIFVGVLGLIPVLRGCGLALQLRGALRVGAVRILHIPASNPDEEEVQLEFLVGSKILWTRHGLPAPWRRA